MSEWRLAEGLTPGEALAFVDRQAVFALQGERITRDLLSEVMRVESAGRRYYVKRYVGAGKGLTCLDKIAKYPLSRPQRVQFHLQYCGHSRLDVQNKQRIRQIVSFFEGRE